MERPDSKNEQALRSTYDHIETVSRLLLSASFELLKRVVTHDRSKLAEPEWEMFARITETLRGLTYGSAEYEAQRKEMLGQALGHHYSHNRHHPEFFEAKQLSSKDDNYKEYIDLIKWIEDSPLELDVRDIENFRLMKLFFEGKEKEATSSINNMTLFDVLEMVIDWRAACNRHADGDINKSIEINTARFSLSPQLVEIIKNTIPLIKDNFEGLITQKDL